MSFQDTWANAPVDTDREAGEPPEPAIYTVELTDAAAVTSKTNGKDWVILEFRAIGEPIDGHTWKVFQGFGSPQQAGFTKRVCRDIGVDTDNTIDLAGLDEQLKLQVGRYFTVEVKQNGEFRNTYIRGTVSPDSFTLPQNTPNGGDVPAAPAAAGNDDIPFLWDGPREHIDRYHTNR